VVFQSLERRVGALVAVASIAGCLLAGCSSKDDAPPLATVSMTLNKSAAALGSPIDITYRFEVAPNAAFDGNYRVFMHMLDSDGVNRWSDDHDPPTKTTEWKPGQVVEYKRTSFIPVVPYLGEAAIRVGLYRADAPDSRAPLSGPEPEGRSYKVATLKVLPQSENIFVVRKSGWHNDEFAPDNPAREWLWTKQDFVTNFRNPKKNSTLYLEYDGRPDLFNQPQMVNVYLGSQSVASFALDNVNPILRRIPLRADQMGTADFVELRIGVDHTFVPANLPGGGKDTRELGVRIYRLFVDPS
jgi:outer membrane murein-binding lipoprotein Lpp